MTKIIALGTGAAFSTKNWQTNFIINKNNKNLLVDCGSDIRWSLKDQELSYKDIDAVYVSHLHADHIGGLEYLGFTRYFTKSGMEATGAANPLPLSKLYCVRELIKGLWENSLRGGMECLEGIECNIDTYFDVVPVERNRSFVWEGLKFDVVQSVHISAKYCVVDSFGLMFTDEDGKRIYLTTDTQFSPEASMKAYYKEADLIVHDCETMYKSGVHAHYDFLKTLPDSIKAKMMLVHFQDNVIEDWDNWNQKAKDDGFIGFVKPGSVF